MQLPSMSLAPKPAISSLQPKPQGLFPTMGSLQEVIDLGESKLPIASKNELLSLLMAYHNSLLKALSDAENKKHR